MFNFIDLGTIDYEIAQKIQKALLEKRIKSEIQDAVLILEHRPVVTIGRIGNINSIKDLGALNQRDIKVDFADRGGDATFHGPGQVILYPIIDLSSYKKDVHAYIRFLEDFAINFFKKYKLIATRIKGKTGVWVDSKKIASIGIGIKKWVTFHGISLNINVDTEPFKFIKVCGNEDIEVTSLDKILNKKLDIKEVKERLKNEFLEVFKRFYADFSREKIYKEISAQ